MAIKSLGYIGISSQQTGAWREFACGVMGLEDVSARCNAQQDEAYFKMDDHPYRLFVSPGDTESLQVCGNKFRKVCKRWQMHCHGPGLILRWATLP